MKSIPGAFLRLWCIVYNLWENEEIPFLAPRRSWDLLLDIPLGL